MNAVFPPPAPTHANPVRTGSFRAGPIVQIVYTPFSRVPCRFHTLFGPTPEEVMAEILRRLDLEPRALRVRTQQQGDVVVLRKMPDSAPPELKPGTVQPAAFVDGLSEAELSAALAALAVNRLH